MKIWAKLFESHGRQILVCKGEDDDGNPCISFQTMLDIGEITFRIGYKNEQGRDDFFERKLGQEFIDKAVDIGFGSLLDWHKEEAGDPA